MSAPTNPNPNPNTTMSNVEIVHHYRCTLCGAQYTTRTEAERCAAQPVTRDKGAAVGRKVRILTGDGAGETATVTGVHVLSKDWGHYRWERYWHTVAVDARLDSGFSRFLTFDGYELI